MSTILSLLPVILIIIAVILLFTFVPIGLWISALAASVKVGIFDLIGMRLRRVSPSKIVNPLIKAEKAGLNVSVSKLEAHYLAGGNVDRVIVRLRLGQQDDFFKQVGGGQGAHAP